jgi:hypothetical protein
MSDWIALDVERTDECAVLISYYSGVDLTLVALGVL